MLHNYEKVFSDYYISQAQGGDGFANIYAGPSFQAGSGIGSFLGGLFRTVWPILKKGAYAVGKESLKSAGNILTDLSNEQKFKQSLSNRSKEGVTSLRNKLISKMNGNGPVQISKTRKRKRQSRVSSSSRKTQPKKKKQKKTKKADIFK